MEKLKLFYLKLKNGLYMPYLYIIAVIILLLLASCHTTKTVIDSDRQSDSVRVEYRNIVTFKDTTIYVPIPYERIVEVVPMLDTLKIESSTAYCEAWLDTALLMINGHLVSSDVPLKTNISTPINTIYRDSIVYKDRFINRTIEKEVPYVPWQYKLFVIIGLAICLLGGIWFGKYIF